MAGSYAVGAALEGITGMMITFERTEDENGGYAIRCGTEDVNKICNQEKKFPAEWITGNGTDIAPAFLEYVKPLVRGENRVPFEDGIAQYLKPAGFWLE
jgi:6-phosphofructokinase 1